MPIPANWLEELVIEWLDLEGFVISTSIGVPAGRGGKFAPDVVGAKFDASSRHLVIRHCEAAMHLIQGPEKDAARYLAKFSQDIQTAVQDRFVEIFGAYEQVEYEKWVITFRPSPRTYAALTEAIPGIRICILSNFVFMEVLPAIKRWRDASNKKTTQLPADKWLLHLIDCFDYFELISRPTPSSSA
jgi:hypothetical protein